MLPNKFNVSDGLFCLGLVLQIFCCNFPSRKAGEGLPKQRLKCFLLAVIMYVRHPGVEPGTEEQIWQTTILGTGIWLF